jgi:hypothetical protein
MRSRTKIASLVAAAALAAPSAAGAQTPATPPTQLSSTGAAQDLGTDAVAPSLTPDAVSHRVLAVWQVSTTADTRSTAARVLDESGRPVGPQLALPAFGATTSAVVVAARPRAGGWIVAAAVSGAARATRVVSLVVGSDGAVGARHDVSAAAPYENAGIDSPSIALDPRTGRGVIAWFLDTIAVTEKPRGGVYARAVDASGRVVGATRAVDVAPKGSSGVDGALTLGFVAKTRRWLAVWQSTRSAGSRSRPRTVRELSARRLLGDATPRGPVRAVGRPQELVDQRVGDLTLVTDTGSSRPMLLYTLDGRTGADVVRLLRLDAGGGAAGRGATTISPAASEPVAYAAPTMVRDPASGGFVVAYTEDCFPIGHEQCPEFTVVHGQRLSSSGSLEGAPGVLAGQAAGSGALERTASGAYLLAWPSPVAFGAPYDDPDAMSTVYPLKSEIAIRSLAL